jgi:hypothetical protein
VLGRNKALDSESHSRLTAAGYSCKVVPTKRVPLVDVKSGVNIWPFDRWRRHGNKCSDTDALWMVSDVIRERLSTICGPVPPPMSPRPVHHK